MKRFLSILICLILIISLVPTVAFAAGETTAASMRLAKCEGTVAVKNASGRKLRFKEDMRLYNNYRISTERKSYAYITLDDSKAVKLDASSQVTISRMGRKLEIFVEKGKLLFDVTKPLGKDEELNIRTSTMITGVRGTVGWIETDAAEGSALYLLEGSTLVTTVDAQSGAVSSTRVSAGQVLASTLVQGEGGGNIQVEMTELVEEEVPGFVSVTISEDPEMQKRIEENTELNVETLTDRAEERLEQEQQQAEEKQKEIQQTVKETVRETVEQLFEEPEPEPDPKPTDPVVPNPEPASYSVSFNMGGHGAAIASQTVTHGNAVSKPADPTETGYTFGGWYKNADCTVAWDFETDTVTADTTIYAKWTKNPTAVTLDGPTSPEEVTEALAQAAASQTINEVIVNNADLTVGELTVPEGETLTLASGYLEVSDAAVVLIEGTLNIGAEAQFTNNGAIEVGGSGAFAVVGEFTNYGSLQIACVETDAGTAAGTFAVAEGAVFSNYGTFIDNKYTFAGNDLSYITVEHSTEEQDTVTVYCGPADGTNWFAGELETTVTFHMFKNSTMILPDMIMTNDTEMAAYMYPVYFAVDIQNADCKTVDLATKSNTLTVGERISLDLVSYADQEMLTGADPVFRFAGSINTMSNAMLVAQNSEFTSVTDAPVFAVDGGSAWEMPNLDLRGCTVTHTGSGAAIALTGGYASLGDVYVDDTTSIPTVVTSADVGISVDETSKLEGIGITVEAAGVAIDNQGQPTTMLTQCTITSTGSTAIQNNGDDLALYTSTVTSEKGAGIENNGYLVLEEGCTVSGTTYALNTTGTVYSQNSMNTFILTSEDGVYAVSDATAEGSDAFVSLYGTFKAKDATKIFNEKASLETDNVTEEYDTDQATVLNYVIFREYTG